MSRATDRSKKLKRAALARAGALAVAALLLVGCAHGGFENENDRLRTVNLRLQRELDRVQQQLDLRTDELAAVRQQLETEPMPVEGARPPQLSRIELDRYSGAVDVDGDGRDDVVRAYVRPLDGQGRFLPVSGKAVVQLVAIADDAPPRVLAQRTLDPAEWDAAYRSGFMGTHYTLELPLPEPLEVEPGRATLHVTLTHGRTGVKLTQQQVVSLTR